MAQLGKFGALDALLQDEEEARAERILKAWCKEEGFDYETLTDQEKADYWFNAYEWHEEQCFNKSQFGVGV